MSGINSKGFLVIGAILLLLAIDVIAQITFVVLKLLDVISWEWLWVCAPLWGTTIVMSLFHFYFVLFPRK